VPKPHVLKEIELPKKVLESDLLINILRDEPIPIYFLRVLQRIFSVSFRRSISIALTIL